MKLCPGMVQGRVVGECLGDKCALWDHENECCGIMSGIAALLTIAFQGPKLKVKDPLGPSGVFGENP